MWIDFHLHSFTVINRYKTHFKMICNCWYYDSLRIDNVHIASSEVFYLLSQIFPRSETPLHASVPDSSTPFRSDCSLRFQDGKINQVQQQPVLKSMIIDTSSVLYHCTNPVLNKRLRVLLHNLSLLHEASPM